jgi:3-oxoacyl-[acyl-carrier-protein] synthase-3
MSISTFNSIEIECISSCVPKNKVYTKDYPILFNQKEKETIIKNTNIHERRIAPSDMFTSDLAFAASQAIFEDPNTGAKPQEIKALVFLSQTHDYKMPFSSNILQHKLKIPSDCLCIDINAACSGFITGLQTAYSIANNLETGKVLFVISETMSKIVSKKDRKTTLIFGDGASALLISKSNQNKSNSHFASFSDGEYADAIKIPSGGSRSSINSDSIKMKEFEDGSERNDFQLEMDALGVYNFTMKRIPPSVINMNNYLNLNPNDIDYYVFHQANNFIINRFIKKLKIDNDKVAINIDRFGNTSGVSIPLAITTELKDKDNLEKVHCVGFGAGLSWGNAIINLMNTKILTLKEI